MRGELGINFSAVSYSTLCPRTETDFDLFEALRVIPLNACQMLSQRALR